jgi:hypothetical protein
MQWTIVIALFALWAFGMVTSRKFGGFIHVLIVAAVILALVGPMELARDSLRAARAPEASVTTTPKAVDRPAPNAPSLWDVMRGEEH